MIKLPTFDAVEYLTHRKFPHYPDWATAKPWVDGILPSDYRDKDLIETYQAELRAKPLEELWSLCDKEIKKEDQEKADRFYDQPNAKADFVHWSKAAYWTLDEAVALSFGKAPEVVKWERVKKCPTSPFVVKYGRVRDLALRANSWKQLYDPVLPSIYLSWARRMEIEVPAELVAQIEARGIIIADCKDLYDKLKEQFDKLVEDRDKSASICKTLIQERDELKQKLEAAQPTASDAPLRESERDSLLKMVLGMAMAAYDYKPGAPRSTVTGENRGSISAGLQQIGLTLDADTVRKFIKEAETRFKDIIQNPQKS